MPYSDRTEQKEYMREYMRSRRAGEGKPIVKPLPAEFRLQRAADVLDVIECQVVAVIEDEEADQLQKARCVGYRRRRAGRVADCLRSVRGKVELSSGRRWFLRTLAADNEAADNRSGMPSTLMEEIASDEVLEEAYRWLCDRRKDYSPNNDVWALLLRWQQIKPLPNRSKCRRLLLQC
jgi:hypothetical protein